MKKFGILFTLASLLTSSIQATCLFYFLTFFLQKLNSQKIKIDLNYYVLQYTSEVLSYDIPVLRMLCAIELDFSTKSKYTFIDDELNAVLYKNICLLPEKRVIYILVIAKKFTSM